MWTAAPEQSLAFIRIKSKTIWRNISFRMSAQTHPEYLILIDKKLEFTFTFKGI